MPMLAIWNYTYIMMAHDMENTIASSLCRYFKNWWDEATFSSTMATSDTVSHQCSSNRGNLHIIMHTIHTAHFCHNHINIDNYVSSSLDYVLEFNILTLFLLQHCCHISHAWREVMGRSVNAIMTSSNLMFSQPCSLSTIITHNYRGTAWPSFLLQPWSPCLLVSKQPINSLTFKMLWLTSITETYKTIFFQCRHNLMYKDIHQPMAVHWRSWSM